IEAQVDVNFFGMTADQVEAVVGSQPVSPFTIPAGTYPSMGEDHMSVSMWNFAIGHADLPESFVYAVVDAVMSQHGKMMEIHKAAIETVPANADKNSIIPWHPGAVRWFEENGISIPEGLRG
ncbi:MAG: TAXI family TRAP transporter solute-binding subunit, partial [Pseudomonadota bacterium]